MGSSDKSIRELVNAYINGEIKLPELQRSYVWKSTQVRDLIDSLYRGYPSGTLLLWDMPKDTPTRLAAIEQGNTRGARELLLDGQQRLTSLSLLMQGKPVIVKDRKRPIDILFNLNHPEEVFGQTQDAEYFETVEDESTEIDALRVVRNQTFVVANNALAKQKYWVSVTKIFQDDSESKTLRDIGFNSNDEEWDHLADRIKRVRDIVNYEYRCITLESSKSYQEVTEIFVRVNSLGTKLRSSDLALAQMTAIWPHSLKEFEGYQNICGHAGFQFDLGIILRLLTIMAKEKAGIGDQVKFNNITHLSQDHLQGAWQDTKAAFDFAINFLREHLKIESLAALSSPFIIVTLSYFLHKNKDHLDNEQVTQLREWIKRCNMKARYSRGSSETILGQDITAIRKGNSITPLLTHIKTQAGKLDVAAEDLELLKSNGAYFKTMFLSFRQAGAQDWKTNLPISMSMQGARHKIEEHHIFPKAQLKQLGHTDDLINNIANLTFISAGQNKSISDNLPTEYLSTLSDNDLEQHCIPKDQSLWELNEYKTFLEARRNLITERLNAYCEDRL